MSAEFKARIENARPYKLAMGLRRVEPGIYVHDTGRLIVLDGPVEGPRGGEVYRWELASHDEYHRYVLDGALPFRTLTEAALWLNEEALNVR